MDKDKKGDSGSWGYLLYREAFFIVRRVIW